MTLVERREGTRLRWSWGACRSRRVGENDGGGRSTKADDREVGCLLPLLTGLTARGVVHDGGAS